MVVNMIHPNSPLALDAWERGTNSYYAAEAVVNHAMTREKDFPYSHDASLTNFIARALHGRLVAQAIANSEQYSSIAPTISKKQKAYVRATKEPDQLMRFLQDTKGLKSIETQRRTHLGNWDTRQAIDAPFRQHLDESPELDTEHRKSKILYRIKDLNMMDESEQHFVQVDRKRTVRQHFGGSILTVVRNSFVLHDVGDHMPEEIVSLIDKERDTAVESGSNYNYDDHTHGLVNALEPHITNHDLSEKPKWIVPLLTTYYAVKREAVKADELKDFS
jgi:hypothetical protein